MYLMTSTKSDIAFVINNCVKYMLNSSKEHYNALNRIWQYIKTIKNRGILYKSNDIPELLGFINSDWDGDYTTRKFITSYIFLLNNSSISWSSKLQKSVTIVEIWISNLIDWTSYGANALPIYIW